VIKRAPKRRDAKEVPTIISGTGFGSVEPRISQAPGSGDGLMLHDRKVLQPLGKSGNQSKLPYRRIWVEAFYGVEGSSDVTMPFLPRYPGLARFTHVSRGIWPLPGINADR
jgi:hypothetical protein